jgi:hypothetical protein
MEKIMDDKSIKRVFFITGAESTGKSTLTEALAKHFGGIGIPEYARTYLESINRPYNYADVEAIARRQTELICQNRICPLVFFDTCLIILKVGFREVYQKMATFLSEIRAHVQSKNLGRPFYLIGNNAHYVPNASQIMPYLDGNVSEANIWSFDGNTRFMAALGDQSFESLNKAGFDLYKNSGKPNFSVEYIANHNAADYEFYASALAYYGLIGSVTTSYQMQTHLEPQMFSNGTTACITATVATITQTCTTRYAAPVKADDFMFNWGERAYADVLRSTNEPSAVTMGYYNRYYPQSQIYIGTKDNQLFYYEANKANGIVGLGKTSTWIQKALR